MYNVTLEAKAGGENKMDKVISTIQWSRDDIEYLLKDNGYEGNTQQIEQFIENFDIEYFEEKCIECGWEILQNEVERIFERRDLS